MKKVFKGHVPIYVDVYNSLYSDIMNGIYPEESYLPSEHELASTYGVSRNTLRQALAILREDGLIFKSQGKGTTVAKRTNSIITDKHVNPLSTMCIHDIDSTEIYYNFGSPTDIGREKLGISNEEMVLASTNIYKSKDLVVGYSFVQVTMTCVSKLGIDLSSKSDLSNLIENQIFELSARSLVDIKLIFANKMESETLNIEEETPLILMEYILYDSKDQAFSRCKFYFIPEYYRLKFTIK